MGVQSAHRCGLGEKPELAALRLSAIRSTLCAYLLVGPGISGAGDGDERSMNRPHTPLASWVHPIRAVGVPPNGTPSGLRPALWRKLPSHPTRSAEWIGHWPVGLRRWPAPASPRNSVRCLRCPRFTRPRPVRLVIQQRRHVTFGSTRGERGRGWWTACRWQLPALGV